VPPSAISGSLSIQTFNEIITIYYFFIVINIFTTSSVFGLGCYSFIGSGAMDWIHVA
jgi:hypothetical protein